MVDESTAATNRLEDEASSPSRLIARFNHGTGGTTATANSAQRATRLHHLAPDPPRSSAPLRPTPCDAQRILVKRAGRRQAAEQLLFYACPSILFEKTPEIEGRL